MSKVEQIIGIKMSAPKLLIGTDGAQGGILRGETQRLALTFSNESENVGYLPCVDLIVDEPSAVLALADSLGATLALAATVVRTETPAEDPEIDPPTVTYAWSASEHPLVANAALPPLVEIDGAQWYTIKLPYSSYHRDQQSHTEYVTVRATNADATEVSVRAQSYFALGTSAIEGFAAADFGDTVSKTWPLQLYRVVRSNSATENERAIGPNYPITWSARVDIADGIEFAEFSLVEQLHSLQEPTDATAADDAYDAPTRQWRVAATDIVGSGSNDLQFSYTTYTPLFHRSGDLVGVRAFDDTEAGSFAHVTPRLTVNATDQTETEYNDTVVAKVVCIRTQRSRTDGGRGAYIPHTKLRYTSTIDIGDWVSGTFNKIQFDADDAHVYDGALETRSRTVTAPDYSAWQSLDGIATVDTNTIAPEYFTRVTSLHHTGTAIEAAGHSFSGSTHAESLAALGGSGPTTIMYRYNAHVSGRFQRDSFLLGSQTERYAALDVGERIGVKSWMWFTLAASTFVDTSAVSTNIGSQTWSKSIYAIDDEVVELSGASSAAVDILPHQSVTFRLTAVFSHANIENLRVQDFAPLPLFDLARDFDGYAGRAIVDGDAAPTSVPPAVGRIAYGPTDTYHMRRSSPSSLTVDSGSNSLRLEWQTYQTDTLTGTHTVDLLYTLRATPARFSDRLLMTNQARWLHDSTFTAAEMDKVAIARVRGRAPRLGVSCATVDADSTRRQGVFAANVVTPDANGNMLARFGEVGAVAAVAASEIDNAALATLLESNSATIQCGDSVRFAALVQNSGGAEACRAKLRWAWQDDSVWSVNAGTLRLYVGNVENVQNGATTVLTPTASQTALFFGSAFELRDASDNAVAIPANGGYVLALFDATLATDAPCQRFDTHAFAVTDYYSHNGVALSESFGAVEGASTQIQTHAPLMQCNIVFSGQEHTGATLISGLLQAEEGNEWLTSGLRNFERAAPGEVVGVDITVLFPQGHWSDTVCDARLASGVLHVDSDMRIGAALTTAVGDATFTYNSQTQQITAADGFQCTGGTVQGLDAQTMRLALLVRLDSADAARVKHRRTRSSTPRLTFGKRGSVNSTSNIASRFRIQCVEPTLAIAKQIVGGGSNGSFDNGDTVRYKLVVSCVRKDSQSVAARHIAFADVLQSDRLTLTGASVVDDTSQTSAAVLQEATASLTVANNTVRFALDKLNVRDQVTLLVDATLHDTVSGEMVPNIGTATYHSLDAGNVAHARQYSVQSSVANVVALPDITLRIENLTDDHTVRNAAAFVGSSSLDARGLPATWADKLALRVRVALPESLTDLDSVFIEWPLASHSAFLWDSDASVTSSSAITLPSASAAVTSSTSGISIAYDHTLANTALAATEREYVEFLVHVTLNGAARGTVDAPVRGTAIGGAVRAGSVIGAVSAYSEVHCVKLVEPALSVASRLLHNATANEPYVRIAYSVTNEAHSSGTAASNVQLSTHFTDAVYNVLGDTDVTLASDGGSGEWTLTDASKSATECAFSAELALGETSAEFILECSVANDSALWSDLYENVATTSAICSRLLPASAAVHASVVASATLPFLVGPPVLIKQLLSADSVDIPTATDRSVPVGCHFDVCLRLYMNSDLIESGDIAEIVDTLDGNFHLHERLSSEAVGLVVDGEDERATHVAPLTSRWSLLGGYRRIAPATADIDPLDEGVEAEQDVHAAARLADEAVNSGETLAADSADLERMRKLAYVQVRYRLMVSNVASCVRGSLYDFAAGASVGAVHSAAVTAAHTLVVHEPTLVITSVDRVHDDVFSVAGTSATPAYRPGTLAVFDVQIASDALSGDAEAYHLSLGINSAAAESGYTYTDGVTVAGVATRATRQNMASTIRFAVRLDDNLTIGDVVTVPVRLRYKSLHQSAALDAAHVRDGTGSDALGDAHNDYETATSISCTVARAIGVEQHGSFALEDIAEGRLNAQSGAQQWGDADYQDIVGRYEASYIVDASGDVTALLCDYILESHGAQYDHDIDVRIPGLVSGTDALSNVALSRSAVFTQMIVRGDAGAATADAVRAEWLAAFRAMQSDSASPDVLETCSLSSQFSSDTINVSQSTQAVMTTHAARTSNTRPTIFRMALAFAEPVPIAFFETSSSLATCDATRILRRAPYELRFRVYESRLSSGSGEDHTYVRCDGGHLGSPFEAIPHVLVCDSFDTLAIAKESEAMEQVWSNFRAWVDAGQDPLTPWWTQATPDALLISQPLTDIMPSTWRKQYKWALRNRDDMPQ